MTGGNWTAVALGQIGWRGKLASGEQTFKAPYRCGCEGCNCTPAALAGLNARGKQLRDALNAFVLVRVP